MAESLIEVGLQSGVLPKQTERMPAGFSLCTALRTHDEAYYQFKPYWDLQYNSRKQIYGSEGNLELDFPESGNLVYKK